MKLTTLIRGSGDVGSAVAHRLFLAGYRVVLHDQPRPSHSRRGMSFVDALYAGAAILEGVTGRYAADRQKVTGLLMSHEGIPVSDAKFGRLCSELRPDILVDACMHKRNVYGAQLDLAPVTIGLGPGFEAGHHVHITIETAWGDDLGTARWSGSTRNLCGEPCMLGNVGRERFVYAPRAGQFRTSHELGASVTRGVQIGALENTALHAQLAGILRGLSHDDAEVQTGSKIAHHDEVKAVGAEIDRGDRFRRFSGSRHGSSKRRATARRLCYFRRPACPTESRP